MYRAPIPETGTGAAGAAAVDTPAGATTGTRMRWLMGGGGKSRGATLVMIGGSPLNSLCR